MESYLVFRFRIIKKNTTRILNNSFVYDLIYNFCYNTNITLLLVKILLVVIFCSYKIALKVDI